MRAAENLSENRTETSLEKREKAAPARVARRVTKESTLVTERSKNSSLKCVYEKDIHGHAPIGTAAFNSTKPGAID